MSARFVRVECSKVLCTRKAAKGFVLCQHHLELQDAYIRGYREGAEYARIDPEGVEGMVDAILASARRPEPKERS